MQGRVEVALQKVIEECADDGDCSELTEIFPRWRDCRSNDIRAEFEFEREQQPWRELTPRCAARARHVDPAQHLGEAAPKCLNRARHDEYCCSKLNAERQVGGDVTKQVFHSSVIGRSAGIIISREKIARMKTASRPALKMWPTESRWSAMFAEVVAFGLVVGLPSRYAAAGPFFSWFVFIVCVGTMAAVQFAPKSTFWHRAEQRVILAQFVLICVLELSALVHLVGDIVGKEHHFGSLELLETAAVLWTINLVIFAMLYWQADRSREEVGATSRGRHFAFAEAEDEEHSPGWEPYFVDYLYLAFLTSIAFGPPDYARPESRSSF